MWEFIKYCFKCLGIAIAGYFGANPKGLTWKTGLVGILTFFVLVGLAILLTHIAVWITDKKD